MKTIFLSVIFSFLVLFSLFVSPAYAIDEYSVETIIPYYSKKSRHVVVGEVVRERKDEEFESDGKKYYLAGFKVEEVFKSKLPIQGLQLPMKMPIVYKLLDQPEVLLQARKEELLLVGCQKMLKGEFYLHPQLENPCGDDIKEIERKLTHDLTAKSYLGYLIDSVGWDLNFREGQKYLAFLDRDSDGKFYFDQPRRFIPLSESDLIELREIMSKTAMEW